MTYGYKKLIFEMLYFICLNLCKSPDQFNSLEAFKRKFDAMSNIGEM